MAKDQDKTDQTYRKWRSAERSFTDLLGTLLESSDTPKIERKLALELTAARAKADKAMDRFFKASLG